jgi:hypothetical protein
VPTYLTLAELPRQENVDLWANTNVLVACTRLDQRRIRVAVDAVFAVYPALGAVFEPFFDKWTSRPGGGWGWAVEPPEAAMAEVIARQRRSFDMRTGRLFAVSLLPGAPDRLVLTASHLCMDNASWQVVVDDLVAAYGGNVLRSAAQDTLRSVRG